MPTALVIDDSHSARRATSLLLGGSAVFDRVLEAEHGLEGFRLLCEQRPDVVVCDLEMPVCDGARFLALRAARLELGRIPVIVVTGAHDPERVGQLFELGAADFVRKPFHPRELVARVSLQLRLRRQEEQLLEVNRHLAELSTTDALTTLRNRRHFDGALGLEIERARRHALPLALVMFDLDHFKELNDEHGHRAGDAVLARVGRLAKAAARNTDIVARYGGEELVALLPHTTGTAARILAERVRREISSAPIPTDTTAVSVTASAGIADLETLGAKADGPGLVHAADMALYRAKREGRNRVTVATPADLADQRHRDGPPTVRVVEPRSAVRASIAGMSRASNG